ncbi:concanavalin A-like lectin/glucanase [Martensiomyces pterosporus]|nr:concanavalin A-like lectin/glucanase [Martensiomyces pterosporus]
MVPALLLAYGVLGVEGWLGTCLNDIFFGQDTDSGPTNPMRLGLSAMSFPMQIQEQFYQRDVLDGALETVIAAGSGPINFSDLYGVGNSGGNSGNSNSANASSNKQSTAHPSTATATSTSTSTNQSLPTSISTTAIATPTTTTTSSNSNDTYSGDTSTGTFTCKSAYIDFSDPTALSKFTIDWCPQNAYQTNNSVVWRLTPDCGTTMIYPHDFHYGKIEGHIRISSGSGVVTTMILLGPPPSDEIDLEWVGKDTTTVQTMYYVQSERVADSIPGAFKIGGPGAGDGDMSTSFHDYAIELNKDSIKWYIDGQMCRELRKTGNQFPTNASRARMGIWDGTQTSGWAGTVDWSKGPFTAEMKWFRFTPYC